MRYRWVACLFATYCISFSTSRWHGWRADEWICLSLNELSVAHCKDTRQELSFVFSENLHVTRTNWLLPLREAPKYLECILWCTPTGGQVWLARTGNSHVSSWAISPFNCHSLCRLAAKCTPRLCLPCSYSRCGLSLPPCHTLVQCIGKQPTTAFPIELTGGLERNRHTAGKRDQKANQEGDTASTGKSNKTDSP